MAQQIVMLGLFWLIAVIGGCSSIPVVEGYHNSVIQGYVVRVNADFAERKPKLVKQVRAALKEDLRYVNEVFPPAALSALKQTVIWVEPETKAVDDTFSGKGVVYHVSPKWLAEHGFLPTKAQGIQVCNANDYLDWRNHQMMILHEFCHAYHHILGYNRPDVIETYEAAKKAELYQQVGYVLAKPGQLKRAYALNNPREYFAELSEAYFGRNDYFPFTREDLKHYDPNAFELIERLWHLSAEEIQQTQAEHQAEED